MNEEEYMGTEDFPCPKCSQLNTIGQTTCKNCGADLKQVLNGSKHKEKTAGGSPTLILGIIAIVIILGVVAFFVMSYNPTHSRHRSGISAPRGMGGAIHATISAAHADYLLSGTTYTLDDVLSGTAFSSGITYQADTDTPASGEIASNAAGTAIILNYYHDIFKWDYIPRNGDEAAYLVETGGNWK